MKTTETINVKFISQKVKMKEMKDQIRDLYMNFILNEESITLDEMITAISNKALFVYKLKDQIQLLSLTNNAINLFKKEGKFIEDSLLYLLFKTIFRSAMQQEKNQFLSAYFYNVMKTIAKQVTHKNQEAEKLLNFRDNLYKKINFDSIISLIKENKAQLISLQEEFKNDSLMQIEDETVYLIDSNWYNNAKTFVDIVLEKSNEDLQSLFEKETVLDNWFNQNENKNMFCGKINNINLIDFINFWFDPEESEQYTNVYLNKKHCDYILLNESQFEKMKLIFDIEKYQTIQRKRNEIYLIDLNILILSKLFIKNSKENGLQVKHIQISSHTSYSEFKEKISRCLHYYLNLNPPILAEDLSFNLCYSDSVNKYDIFSIVVSYINNQDKSEFDLSHLKMQFVNDEETFNILKNQINQTTITILLEINEKNSPNTFLYQGNNKCHLCKNSISEITKCNILDSCQVQYCCFNCLNNDKNHKQFHLRVLNKYLVHKGNPNLLSLLSFDDFYTNESRRGLTGLENLGNTCFMNSALQCLSNCDLLTLYFLSEQYKDEINTNTKYGSGGQIAEAYHDLVNKLWIENKPHIHPINFRQIFVNFVKQFAGFSQQDSHEMLTFMLDGLHEDLNRNIDKKYVELSEQKENETDLQASQRWWNNLLIRDNSIIVDLFYGQYKSTVQCNVCNKISITYDPFMCLGIPISIIMTKTVYIISQENEIRKVKLTFQSKDTIETILQNNIDEYQNKFFVPILCDESKKYLRWLQPSDELAIYFEDNKSRRLILYEYKKDFVKGKVPIIISPMTLIKGEQIMLFYPKPFWFENNQLIECLINDINESYNNYFKNIESLQENDEKKENQKKNYEIKFVNNLTVPSKGKYPCDQCNSFNCVYCDFKFQSSDTIDTIFKSLLKPRKVLLFVQFPSEMFTTNKPHQEIKLYKDYLEDDDYPPKTETTLDSCLTSLSQTEKLDHENTWYCSNCKEHREAYKTLQIMKAPYFLIIQIKRFKSLTGLFNNSKNDTLVDFPISNFSLDPYIVNRKEDEHYIYDLFAINQHFGWSIGGHYTAFIKNNEQWYDFDDETVSKINDNKLVTNNAYLLFYKIKK